MDKESKGQRKLRDWRRATSCSRIQPRILLLLLLLQLLNQIYIAGFNTNGILTTLYIVITYLYTNAICA